MPLAHLVPHLTSLLETLRSGQSAQQASAKDATVSAEGKGATKWDDEGP